MATVVDRLGRGVLLVFAVASFLLPGLLATRRVPSRAPLLSAFLASAILLFEFVLLLHALHVPLQAGTLAPGWALVGIVLLWLTRRNVIRPRAPEAVASEPKQWLWWCAIGVGLLSVALRAIIDPLSGYDNGFRWDHLAKLMLAQHSLAGYPPVTAHDFELYAWCDGIPPLVPLLNMWLYMMAGSTAPIITAVRVTAEALLIGYAVAKLSESLWGRPAKVVAPALLAASALFLWSVAIGQETGMTTLAFVSLLYFVNRDTFDRGDVFWAALAAATGALSREYGLLFIPFGGLALVLRHASRRHVLLYLATAMLLVAPWYIRNWFLTGNPVYPQALGGLFPTNPVHTQLSKAIAAEWSLRTSPYNAWQLPVWIAALAGLPLLFGAIGMYRAGRRGMVLGGGAALIAIIWFISIPQTAAGWIVSLRVLAPMIAICAAFAGWAGRLRGRMLILFGGIVAVAAVDAARRSWFIPTAPLSSPASLSFRPWREQNATIQNYADGALWPLLVSAAQDDAIVVDLPVFHQQVLLAGGHPVPLVSPLLAPTLAANGDFNRTVATLRRNHVRFVTLHLNSGTTRAFVATYWFWQELCTHHAPTVRSSTVTIFDLQQLANTRPAGNDW